MCSASHKLMQSSIPTWEWNLGLPQSLKEAKCEHYLQVKAIIELAHNRGADELIHRSIKEMATKKQLPFKKIEMNTSYYFIPVCCHFVIRVPQGRCIQRGGSINGISQHLEKKIDRYRGQGYLICQPNHSAFIPPGQLIKP